MKLYGEDADLIYQTSYHDPLLSYLTDTIVNLVDHSRRKSILDLGCGTGRSTVALAKKGHFLFAVDISEKALTIAKKQAEREGCSGNVTFFRLDARKNLPFSRKFDFCICSEVIEHIDDSTTMIARAYRCLKPGGALILTTPHDQSQWSILDDYAQHKHRYTPNEIRLLLRKFKVTQLYTIGFPLFRTFLYLYNASLKMAGLDHDSMVKRRKNTLFNTLYFFIGKALLSFDRSFNFTHKGTTIIAVAAKPP